MIELSVPSEGLGTSIDLTDTIADALRKEGVSAGFVTVLARGSSLAVVVMRYEPGTIRDLRREARRRDAVCNQIIGAGGDGRRLR